MVKHFIDPSFDPLQELRETKERLNQLEANFHRLVEAHNAQGNLVRQIAQQNTELLNMINSRQLRL